MDNKYIDKIIFCIKDNLNEVSELEILAETTLISSGLIDSFDLINIITMLEEEFNIEISLEKLDLDLFNTPKSICELIADCKRKDRIRSVDVSSQGIS